jgi:hypothetical protein
MRNGKLKIESHMKSYKKKVKSSFKVKRNEAEREFIQVRLMDFGLLEAEEGRIRYLKGV